MNLQKKIETSFNVIAERALAAYLPNAEHDATKQHLAVLRGELQKYLKLVEEVESKKGPDHSDPSLDNLSNQP